MAESRRRKRPHRRPPCRPLAARRTDVRREGLCHVLRGMRARGSPIGRVRALKNWRFSHEDPPKIHPTCHRPGHHRRTACGPSRSQPPTRRSATDPRAASRSPPPTRRPVTQPPARASSQSTTKSPRGARSFIASSAPGVIRRPTRCTRSSAARRAAGASRPRASLAASDASRTSTGGRRTASSRGVLQFLARGVLPRPAHHPRPPGEDRPPEGPPRGTRRA